MQRGSAAPATALPRRQFLRLAAVGSAALLAACGGGQATASPALKTFGGTLPTPTPRAGGDRLTIAYFPTSSLSVDPLDSPGDLHMGLMYTPLVGVTPAETDVDLRYGVAEKIDASPDGKTLTIKVRSGIKFHNGDTLTAKDVRFSIERSMSGAPDQELKATLAGVVSRVDQPDASTVIVSLKGPSATLMTELSPLVNPLYIVPADYYSQVGPNGFAAKPVGSGPYEWIGGERDAYVELKARPGTHPLLGRPRYRSIRFNKVREVGTRGTMLRTGEADLAELHRDLMAGLQQAEFTIQFKKAQRVVGLVFSADANASLRRAASLAVDRDGLARSILGGIGVSPWGVAGLPPAELSSNVAEYRQAAATPDALDVAQAKKLLADAGPTSLELVVTNQFPEQPQLAEAVRQMLAAAGIQTELRTLDFATFQRGWGTAKNQATLYAAGNGVVGLGEARSLFGGSAELGRLLDAASQAKDVDEYKRLFSQVAVQARQAAVAPGLFALDGVWGYTPKLPIWGLEQSRARSGLALQKLTLDIAS